MIILLTVSLLISLRFIETKVCQSLDVRNSPDKISNYRDCRVIEGHLQVVLMERSTDVTDYYNKSFSELYEIRDYLIVYRLMGLPSLNLIFPKLASIKGRKLFFGYALVLYDLQNLEEIGLTSLTSIEKGGLRIGNCSNLCYVDTIDWRKIGVTYVTYNKTSVCKEESCPFYCTGSCWNERTCQKFEKNNCHPYCIGCRKINSPKDCITCKYFNNSGICVQKCPETKLTDNVLNQCVTVSECISRKWAVLGNTCIEKCPSWLKKNLDGKCIQTDNITCNGMEINSHFDLYQLIRCTHINGALEISIQEYVHFRDFEVSLGMIKHISEYLKITRTNSITTLSFFKNLEIIDGKRLWSKYYALYIVENENLQKLFNKSSIPFIKKGEALIQNNPILCQNEIKTLKVKTTASNNGFKTSCNLVELKFQIIDNNSRNVAIVWKPPAGNNSVVIGYTIYYQKVTHEYRSVYKIRNGIADKDGSESEDILFSDFTTNNTISLNNLKPFTHYHFFVTSYLHSSLILQSPTYVFQTAAGDPSEPVNFKVESQGVGTITLKWSPPFYPNGKLSHYRLAVYLLDDYIPMIRQRNYCTHPFHEKNCSCPEKQLKAIHSVFSLDKTCIGIENSDCYSNTIYYETNKEDGENQHLIRRRSLLNRKYEYVQEYEIKSNKTGVSYIIHGLKHFTVYSFYLQACNKQDKSESHCGGYEMIFQRTLKLPGADSIASVTIRFDDEDVVASWEQPKEPNSVILAYNIEIKENASNISYFECVTSEKFETDGCKYRIKDLTAGKYCLRVRAVSLSGSGEASNWEFFEIVQDTSNWGYWLLGFLAVVTVVIIVFAMWKKHRIEQEMEMDRTIIAEMRARIQFEEDEWKLDDETVEIIRELEQNSILVRYQN